MIRYEGVTFVKSACLKLSREDFVKQHIDVFWTDRDKATRRKMLNKAYDLIAPPVKAE
ncbi:MAG: hypothetical protein HUK14_06040 [Muribaculaceae bacterium]|nr:hypothetical protein [Muribaculaceae bacterium]